MNNHKLNSLGIEIPSILLPKAEYMDKWPVIACDQFTQDRGYWEKTKNIVAGSPSSLNLIFPEVFLSDSDASQRIEDIHLTMERYLKDGVFAEPKQGFIYTERDTPYQKKRRGLVAAVDLEKYDWHPEARPLNRCTEGTVPERLPARMEIRRGAPLELPHVLLLMDDDTDALLTQLGERVKKNAPCYSTQLMMDSGSVTGWFVNEEDDISFIEKKLDELCAKSITRYGDNSEGAEANPFLFAVGDGNHSLASAKEIWEEYKAKNKTLPFTGEADYLSHPCRYALVEIENIYDSAIQFEPIHRVVFDIGFKDTVSLLSRLPDLFFCYVSGAEELAKAVRSRHYTTKTGANRFGVISEGRYALIETSAAGIATACLQPLLDSFAGDNPQLIDYIHDEKEIFRLAGGKEEIAGILLPPVLKSGLFQTVAHYGPLPRKSFSMGHSSEKRFYLESRKII